MIHFYSDMDGPALMQGFGTEWLEQDAATPIGRSVPVQLHAHAFMPPWTIFTGLDFAGIAPYVDAISPKLYTMHWAQMIVR